MQRSPDRGAIVCSTNAPSIGVFGENFQAHFVPRCRLAAFLSAWLAAPDTVLLQRHFMNAHILQAVDNYHPQTDVVLLLEYGDRAGFFLLRNLPITPSLCYEIVCKEWVEFQPQHTLRIKEKI